MAEWLLVLAILLVSQVTTVPIDNNMLMANDRFLEEPINSDELQLRNLNPSVSSVKLAIDKAVASSPKMKSFLSVQDSNDGAGQHPKEIQQKLENNTETEAEELSGEFDTILKDVLLTLRDHPDIVKDILEDEEYGEISPTSPQLDSAPKQVEKKSGWRHHVPKFSKGLFPVKSKEDDSSEENYFKMRYGTSESRESDDSRESENSIKYDSSEENSKSSEEDKSSSSDSSSREIHSSFPSKWDKYSNLLSRKLRPIKTTKRRPEEYEPTIDLTSLPEEGGQDDPVNAGNKRKNETHKTSHLYGQELLESNKDELISGFQDPFINPLPVFEPEDFQLVKDVEATGKFATKSKTKETNKDKADEKGSGVANSLQKTKATIPA